MGGNIPGTPLMAGVHYQQKGGNGGFSVYGGLGFQSGGFMAGSFYCYNINKGYSTVGISAGYGGTFAKGGITYSRTYDSDGNLLHKGFSGYGQVNIRYGVKYSEEENTSTDLPTSENSDRSISPSHYASGDTFVFGPEGMEGGWLAFFDVVGFHATAIFHDYLVTRGVFDPYPTFDYSLSRNAWDTCGFGAGYIGGNAMAGQNYYSNPYTHTGMWE